MRDEGQGSLACCSPWGRRESDTTAASEPSSHIRPAPGPTLRTFLCQAEGAKEAQLAPSSLRECGSSRGTERDEEWAPGIMKKPDLRGHRAPGSQAAAFTGRIGDGCTESGRLGSGAGVGGRSRQAWYQGRRDPSHRGVILCHSVDPAGKSGGVGAHGEAAKQPPRWAGVPDNHSLATLPRTRGTILNTALFPSRPRDLAGHRQWLSEAEYPACRPPNPTPTTTDPGLLRLCIHRVFSGRLMRFHWFVIFFCKVYDLNLRHKSKCRPRDPKPLFGLRSPPSGFTPVRRTPPEVPQLSQLLTCRPSA